MNQWFDRSFGTLKNVQLEIFSLQAMTSSALAACRTGLKLPAGSLRGPIDNLERLQAALLEPGYLEKLILC